MHSINAFSLEMHLAHMTIILTEMRKRTQMTNTCATLSMKTCREIK